MHVKKLENCGLIKVGTKAGKRGTQKICHLLEDKLIIDLIKRSNEKVYETEISVGHYGSYKLFPTCGLANADHIIGEIDNPSYFADPDRINSEILWFTRGFIEYNIPNYLKNGQRFEEIQISLELSSEAPGVCNDWPSDIYFYLNDHKLGYWRSPGDFGETQGIFTPSWWYPNWNQYGLLKLISINKKGADVDGLKISDITLDEIDLDYQSDIKFKLEVPKNTENVGGITLYGKHFGNYNQGIQVRILYDQ